MTIRYGLIGAGMMGQEHIRNVALLDGVEIAALADPDDAMRRRAEELAGGSVRAFSHHPDLLSAGLCDAYIVAAPNDTHHRLLLDVLPAGKPVLCEKPLCTTSTLCREVIATAGRTSTPVWVAMEYRYKPPFQRLLAEARTGRAGSVRMMSIREHRYPFLDKVGAWNRFNRRTGGTLVEKCCHFWDLMRLTLASDPVRVYASAAIDVNHLEERYGGAAPDIVDNAFVIVDFESGARALLDLCMFAEGAKWQEVISLTGTKARIDARMPGPRRFSGQTIHAELVVSDRASKAETVEEIPVDETLLEAGDHHGATFYQHRKFLAFVRDGGRPEVTLEDGLWSVRVGEAAELSARTGQAVALDTV